MNNERTKNFRDLNREWEEFFKDHSLDSIQMTYVSPTAKSKYYMMANLLYLYQVEPQMTALFSQKMNYDAKLIESFKEGLNAAYQQNFTISQEDQLELARVMEDQKEGEHKGKTLHLV